MTFDLAKAFRKHSIHDGLEAFEFWFENERWHVFANLQRRGKRWELCPVSNEMRPILRTYKLEVVTPCEDIDAAFELSKKVCAWTDRFSADLVEHTEHWAQFLRLQAVMIAHLGTLRLPSAGHSMIVYEPEMERASALHAQRQREMEDRESHIKYFA